MSADSKASNSKFLKGTLILTASSIVVKVIGSLNWIILSRVLGGEGIGLYQMGFPIYLMAITVSSAGVPVAISIITSEKLANKDYRGAKRVFNVSLRVLLLTGLLFSSSLFFGADWLVNNHIIRDSRAYYSIIALAPAVFFVTFLASFRGYLQGWQIMTPTAVSEIVEQLTRVITMLVFADLFDQPVVGELWERLRKIEVHHIVGSHQHFSDGEIVQRQIDVLQQVQRKDFDIVQSCFKLSHANASFRQRCAVRFSVLTVYHIFCLFSRLLLHFGRFCGMI